LFVSDLLHLFLVTYLSLSRFYQSNISTIYRKRNRFP